LVPHAILLHFRTGLHRHLLLQELYWNTHSVLSHLCNQTHRIEHGRPQCKLIISALTAYPQLLFRLFQHDDLIILLAVRQESVAYDRCLHLCGHFSWIVFSRQRGNLANLPASRSHGYPSFNAGIIQPIMPLTAINLMSEVIGTKGDQGALVSSIYSFVEKIVVGVVVYLVTSTERFNANDPEFIRNMIVFVPSTSCLCACLLAYLWRIK
jgi:hypothetical protein